MGAQIAQIALNAISAIKCNKFTFATSMIFLLFSILSKQPLIFWKIWTLIHLVHLDVKFTLEVAFHKTIKFLDMEIKLTDDSLKTNWCLKATNTGLYIPKISYSLNTYKKNAIQASYIKSPYFR